MALQFSMSAILTLSTRVGFYLVGRIHTRMPVMLPKDAEMEAYEVSRLVNKPDNDVPEAIAPVTRLPGMPT